jgi:hypothetical protein
MTKMGGIKKKNNTLSGVFLGEFALFDLPASFLLRKRFFCRHPVPIFRKKAERLFWSLRRGFVFAAQKLGCHRCTVFVAANHEVVSL